MKFVFDKDKNLFEALDKEETIAAIVNYLETHAVGDVDTGFVTTIKEQNADKGLKFWIGTTAQYNAIETKDTDTLYILTDDSELQDIEAKVEQAYAAWMEISGKKGVVLLNQQVNYGTGLSVDLTGAFRAEDYDIVKVSTNTAEALCNVNVTENTVRIVGQTAQYMSSSTALTIVTINLTIDRQNNRITQNKSTTTLIMAGGTPTISETPIYKITGVY